MLVVAVLIALTACGTDPSIYNLGCTRIVTVTATTEVSPRFGWSPGCQLGQIAVYEVADPTPGRPDTPPGEIIDGQLMWDVATTFDDHGSQAPNNLLSPSVRYGQTPSGATTAVSAKPLVSGKKYHVVLYHAASGGPGWNAAGALVFTQP